MGGSRRLRIGVGAASASMSLLFGIFLVAESSAFWSLYSAVFRTDRFHGDDSYAVSVPPARLGSAYERIEGLGVGVEPGRVASAVWSADGESRQVVLTTGTQDGRYLKASCPTVQGVMGDMSAESLAIDQGAARNYGIRIGDQLVIDGLGGAENSYLVSGLCAETPGAVQKFHPFIFAASKGISVQAFAKEVDDPGGTTWNRLFLADDPGGQGKSVVGAEAVSQEETEFTKNFLGIDLGLYALVVPLCLFLWALSTVAAGASWAGACPWRRAGGTVRRWLWAFAVASLVVGVVGAASSSVGSSALARTCSNIGISCPSFRLFFPALAVVALGMSLLYVSITVSRRRTAREIR